MKRIFDAAVSAAALLLFSPLLGLIALLVWLESGSPVIFSQRRIGRRFRTFNIYKFRTMGANTSGPKVTVAGDRRITRVGRVLRKAKLDELPQFWNVLKGDMSLVGPRPEVPEYVALYRARYERILELRPGITDLASIRFRDEELQLSGHSDPHRYYALTLLPFKLDLSEKYLASRSFRLDLKILFDTAVVTLRRTRPVPEEVDRR